jgi:hypothetical protein
MNGLANKYKDDFTGLIQAQHADDIIVYCDQDRITKVDDEYVDTINEGVFDAEDSYESCEGLEAGDDIVAAWTLQMDEVTVIQLCPWYLQERLAGFTTQQPAYVTPAVLDAAYQISTSPPANPPSPCTDIECFALLDQLILHEVCITGYILHQPKQIMILRLMY